MNSLATMYIDTRTPEQIRADNKRWKNEEIKRIQKEIKEAFSLKLPVDLNNIGKYHDYWQKYHCSWDYDDYSEDFSFKKFLDKLSNGYKQKKLKLLQERLLDALNEK